MNLNDGFCTTFNKQGSYESHQISACSITHFYSPFEEDSPNLIRIKREKQTFFAGIMTIQQEDDSAMVKQLKELGFECVEKFRNKHIGNVLCYYRRMPEKLLIFKESEDGMGIVVTS